MEKSYLKRLSKTGILFTVLCVGLIFQRCDKPEQETQTGKDLVLTEVEQKIIKKSNDFAFEIYEQALPGLENDNALLSPLSIQAALAMSYQGARGETREAIAKAIFLDDFDTEIVNTYFKKLIEDLPRLDPQTKMEIANSIWYRQGFDVVPAFLDVNRQYFQSEAHSLDFNAPESVGRINDWVKGKTHGLIESIVDQLEADMVMLLLNAVYFKGTWEHPFDELQTRMDTFHVGNADARAQVEFMQTEHTYPVLDHEQFLAVELPYGNKTYSMIALLPQGDRSNVDLATFFQTPGQWSDVMQETRFQNQKIRLRFPKFKFSYSNVLNDELIALGMGLAFSEEANFKDINTAGKIEISEVNHKSFIEVNEEGTEAAAVTSVGIEVTSVPVQPKLIQFDRPFVFAIRENTSGLIVFLGQVNDPRSETTEL